MRLLVVCLLLLPLPALAETAIGTPPAVALASLRDMQEGCAGFGGVLSDGDDSGTSGKEAFNAVDLTGDGVGDWILDQGVYQCSAAAWSACGTSGCGLEVYIGDAKAVPFLAKSWEVIAGKGPGALPVLSMITSGEACGLAPSRLCKVNIQWQDGQPARISAIPAN